MFFNICKNAETLKFIRRYHAFPTICGDYRRWNPHLSTLHSHISLSGYVTRHVVVCVCVSLVLCGFIYGFLFCGNYFWEFLLSSVAWRNNICIYVVVVVLLSSYNNSAAAYLLCFLRIICGIHIFRWFVYFSARICLAHCMRT